MIKTRRRRRTGGLESLSLLAAVLVGCTTLVTPGGLSDVDRAFVQAALSWDQDKDGQVTCAEWQAYARELFEAADIDRDGRLSASEFQRISRDDKTFIYADFGYYDLDRDGRVSRAEFIERKNPAITHLDVNGDCVLDAEELGKARVLNRAPPSGPPPGMDKGGKGGGMPGGKGM